MFYKYFSSHVAKVSSNLKYKTFIIPYINFTESKFISVLIENLLILKTLLVKVVFKEVNVFYTCGSQLGIRILDHHDSFIL